MPLARQCINYIVGQILSARWVIKPTDEAIASSGWDSLEAEKTIRELTFWLKEPDQDFEWREWARIIFSELLEIDAVALKPVYTRTGTGGVCGSGLIYLNVIDGSSIKPLLYQYGNTPVAGEAAYEQYLWGLPRSEIIQPIAYQQNDIILNGKITWTSSQLIYLKRTSNFVSRPYGRSPVEEALPMIFIALSRLMSAMDYYNIGTMPASFVNAGQEMEPGQIRDLEDQLNAMKTYQGNNRRIKVIPYGSRPYPMLEANLASEFDSDVTESICSSFGVIPDNLGYTGKGTSMTGDSGAAGDSNADLQKQKSEDEWMWWFKDHFLDKVIQKLIGQPDFEWFSPEMSKTQDSLKQAQIDQIELQSGVTTINMVRSRKGDVPIKADLADIPIIQFGKNVIPITNKDVKAGEMAPPNPKPVMPGLQTDDTKPDNIQPDGSQTTIPPVPTDNPPDGQDLNKMLDIMPLKLDELEKLRRNLKNGGEISKWNSKYLEKEVIKMITDNIFTGIDYHTAINNAREYYKGL